MYGEGAMTKQGKRYIQCPDRMCGADDCPRCRPENFRGGVYIEDIEEEEEGAGVYEWRE